MVRIRKRRKPVPWPVTLAMSFIAEGLTPHDYERELHLVVRRMLPHVHRHMGKPSPMEMYDERVSKIIEEECALN